MKVNDILTAIEACAPLHSQESWDHSGLQLGNANAEITAALLCVDVTEEVIQEAVEKQCGLIIAHHPLLFHGLHALTGATPVERCVLKAIQHNIAIYSSHTPMDKWSGGISMRMAQKLGLHSVEILSIDPNDHSMGLGAWGELEQPMTLEQFLSKVRSAFHNPLIRHTRSDCSFVVQRVALCGGSGSDFTELARQKGADVYLSSDFKYHDFFAGDDRFVLMDIGHYESEVCVKELFFEIISKKFPTFALHYAMTDKSPIAYL